MLARYILQDDSEQAARARALLEGLSQGNPGFISHVVLSELVWVLRRGYGYSRRDIAEALELLLTSEEFLVEEPALGWAAFRAFQVGRADYADYLIAHGNKQKGCSHTVTFDRKAATHLLFKLLE